MERHKFIYEENFEFEAGGSVKGLELVYHCSEGGYHGQKVIWICHALTANSDPSDWWPQLVGPGKLFDTDKYFVMCGNMLCSSYGSSGPATINPATGKTFFFDFPKTTVRDIVKALDIMREHAGVPQIDLLIGASIGGFQAIEYSVMFPDLIRHAAFIATLERVTPWLTAFEESQRMALEADQTFRACESLDGGKEGLKCARSIALISYRSEEGYNIKQPETDVDTIFADRSASYQRYQGKKLADRFDAYSYWYLAYGVDSQNVGRGRGGVKAALAQIKAEVTMISIDSDVIFPAHAMADMADMVPGADYHMITSLFGHDGFLLEADQITEIMAPVLERL
ncbi:MAG: alpha/beta fold hydrolase [Bacteroidales bacterium]|nr:alpha/beta fold hydrolase [Bacteroidales bacterium]